MSITDLATGSGWEYTPEQADHIGVVPVAMYRDMVAEKDAEIADLQRQLVDARKYVYGYQQAATRAIKAQWGVPVARSAWMIMYRALWLISWGYIDD